MSYENPAKEDRQKLIEFREQLNKHQNRGSEQDIVIDNIRTSFDGYLNPSSHSDSWSPPFPPMSRDEFRDSSVAEREVKTKETSREHIQKIMESSALLSQLHPVPLQDIKGLEQSPEELRKKLNDTRSNCQTTIAEFS